MSKRSIIFISAFAFLFLAWSTTLLGQNGVMTLDEFNKKIGKKEKPVLVYFYADWCAPCRELKPVLDQLEKEEAQKFDLIRLDADVNPNLADHFEINTLPYFVIFKNGRNVWHNSGALTKQDLLNKINFYK